MYTGFGGSADYRKDKIEGDALWIKNGILGRKNAPDTVYEHNRDTGASGDYNYIKGVEQACIYRDRETGKIVRDFRSHITFQDNQL